MSSLPVSREGCQSERTHRVAMDAIRMTTGRHARHARAFCDAVEQRNGKAFAELFTEDGVYHDVFYGAFEGRAKIAELDRRLVLSHGDRFPLGHARSGQRRPTLYARYTFSYRSTLPEAEGARAMFEGVAIMTAARRQDRGVSRGRQHRAGFRRHEFRAGADRQDRREAGRGAEGAAGDEAASGGVSRPSFRDARSANPEYRGRREIRIAAHAPE